MTAARSTILVLLTIAAATLAFWAVLHQISSLWLDVALRPEVREALAQSMEDQKKLRTLDPAKREEYRRRFDATRQLLNRIEVIRMNRAAMLRRFELTLLVAFALVAVLAATSLSIRYRRARERERRSYLERVTTLQETARRHAHEIKGPLTAARLEAERIADVHIRQSVTEELDRLARFTREFSTFGGLGKPVLRRESLGEMIAEFCATFAQAWPGLDVIPSVAREPGVVSQQTHASQPRPHRSFAHARDDIVCVDRDLFRQVLVNLCTNSAHANATRVTFAIARDALDVSDDGEGVPESMRQRIFDPYVTTGKGMGLGLAISRKVLLEHGGDLRLVESSAEGTTFRITFGEPACS